MKTTRDGARNERHSPLDRYRLWLRAAALYNLIAGGAMVAAPSLFFHLVRMPPPNYLPLWQVLGMFILVYAPGYWWASRDPDRLSHLVLIGLLGKIFGPVGFVWSALTGQLPLAFGAVLITNDLVWWPSFVAFVRQAAHLEGGWRIYLFGIPPGGIEPPFRP